MNQRRSALRAPARATFDLGVLATPPQRYAALATCVTLIAAACCAALFGLAPGPEIKPFVPITATICSLADLLTAFLLLAQFFVSGKLSLAVLAIAYGFSGYMSLSFLAYFPGVFRSGALTIGDEQLSSVLWWLWHCTFPLLIVYAALNDAALGRVVSRRKIGVIAGVAAITPLIAVSAISIVAFLKRESLPHLIVHGVFQHAYKTELLPVAVALNALACGLLLARKRRLTPLALWLAVATFSTTLESLMVNLSYARYSYAWDAGKLITVFTASIVLLMMLSDIVGLYVRLAGVARIDMLTSLANRRAYEERFEMLLRGARRSGGSLALLVIDIDLFKRYNDSYGHLAGDECLRRVALALLACVTRPLDLVARYGGEEFVVVLPDTPLRGVLTIAERLREAVENLATVDGERAFERITVSIGLGYASNARNVSKTALFETADGAMYEAKARGRNRVVLGSTEPRRSGDDVSQVLAGIAVPLATAPPL